ncbi:hypothetical protein BM477_07860 [Boudabousia marimammalium]|uniref:Uncharacterized protein n=2 Tax=Boudabousia marimammalium TaxID=156892 RepID=A0A1Q5PJ84_9ACTO|nr:hypothetical protein BM477_07860 [Boudabousia marimammalium]
MSKLLYPQRPIRLYVLVGLIAMICFIQSFLLIPTWADPDLRVIIPYLREEMVLPSVVLGFFAAIMLQPQNSRSVILGSITALSPWQRIRPFAITLWTGALLGSLLGWSYILTRGMNNGWRTVDLLPLSVLFISLFACSTLAMVFASLTPGKSKLVLAPLLTVLTVFAPVFINRIVLNNTGLSSISLGFIWGDNFVSYPSDFVVSTELIRATYFLLLGLCGFYALIKTNVYAISGRKTFAIQGMAFFIPPLLVFASTIAMSPVVVKYYEGPESCVEVGQQNLCLPVAQSKLLPRLKKQFTDYFAQLPDGWIKPGQTIGLSSGTFNELTLFNPGSFSTLEEWEARSFTNSVHSLFIVPGRSAQACEEGELTTTAINSILIRANLPMETTTAFNIETGQEVEHTITVEDDPNLAFLVKLPTSRYHEWLQNHRKVISECRLTKDMFK